MAGCSGKPLAAKLGIKPGFRVKTSGSPSNYQQQLNPLPSDVTVSTRLRTNVDLWHLFVTSRARLESQIHNCIKQIVQNGMIWVSWPKKSSGVQFDITRTPFAQWHYLLDWWM